MRVSDSYRKPRDNLQLSNKQIALQLRRASEGRRECPLFEGFRELCRTIPMLKPDKT